MTVLPTKINILQELERLEVKYDFGNENNVKVLCPFHDDGTPSCSLNTDTGEFLCFSCKKGGDFLAFMSRVLDRPRAIVYVDLQRRYNISDEPTTDPAIIEAWHTRIWSAHPLLKELYARGVTDELIRKYRLGEEKGRITIPIWNHAGHAVNVKKYLPGAAGPQKMRNMRGRGKPQLYPYDQLRFKEIALCGGEMKAIVAAKQLNEVGIGAISTTVGEANWDKSFSDALAGKDKVWIIDDIDETGVKASEMKARLLSPIVQWVGVVTLPLDKNKHPKGDINDYIATENGNLVELLKTVEQWVPPAKASFNPDEMPVGVTINQAYSAEYTTKRVAVDVVVTSIDESTYVIPEEIVPSCDRAQDCCGICPVYLLHKTNHIIHPEDPALLDMIDEHSGNQRDAMMRSMDIPRECQSVQFATTSYHQADDVRISPKLEILSRATDRSLMRVLCTKGGLQLNENYRLVGRQYPHPRNQAATLLVSDFESTGDALSNYTIDDHQHLVKFRPKEWTVDSLQEKLDEIYADLEYNVTHIRMRQKLHLAMDLVWHSPLFITLDDRVEKGYVEVLVVGDSAQGKSETAKRLLEHYGAGVKVECKNATVAGLLGGVAKMAGRWFVSWGIIPMHDKRMVILEELKGASTEVVSKLTEMRSSGVAEMPKIEKRKTASRARLLAISNPRSDRPMSAYSFGIEAVKELIGALEDIRRFDMCFVVSRDEVDASVINTPRSEWPKVEVVYDAESCHSLILWAWTRTETQAMFEDAARVATLKFATKLNEQFTSEIPIVDVASMRYKIARLSAALAARTFSTSDDGMILIVRPCHVEYIYNYLVSIYSASNFGYIDYTKSVRDIKVIADIPAIEKCIKNAPYAREFSENMLRTSKFDQQDIMDWCASDRVEAASILSLFVRKRAVVRDGRGYVKTPGMIDILKRLIEEGLPEMPPHLREGEF